MFLQGIKARDSFGGESRGFEPLPSFEPFGRVMVIGRVPRFGCVESLLVRYPFEFTGDNSQGGRVLAEN